MTSEISTKELQRVLAQLYMEHTPYARERRQQIERIIRERRAEQVGDDDSSPQLNKEE